MDSILDSVKKTLGIDTSYKAFDVDILMHINTVFAILSQLGVGPENGLTVEDDSSTWSDFLGDDPKLNAVKTYVSLRVRILFDPPTGSYHLVNSLNQQIQELEWRISTQREDSSWTDPAPVTPDPDLVQYVPIPVNDAWAGG